MRRRHRLVFWIWNRSDLIPLKEMLKNFLIICVVITWRNVWIEVHFFEKKWILWILREDEYPYVSQNCSCASAGVCGEEYHNVFTHFYRVFQCYFTRDGAIWWWYIYSNEINNLGAKNKPKIAKKIYIKLYITFDMFGRLYSWKWLGTILWLLAGYGKSYEKALLCCLAAGGEVENFGRQDKG